jgi:SAM-dependent methyltransferase
MHSGLSDNIKEVIRPICTSKKWKLLTGIDFMQLPDCPLPCHYDIVACCKCGFVYNEMNVARADFDKYYASMSKYDTPNISGAGQMPEMDSKGYEKFIAFLAPFISADTPAIADIGCARGGLQQTCKKHGYHNLFGLDPSKACVVLLQYEGIEAETGELLNFNAPRKFDIIMFTSVLEYIFDLQATVTKLADMLSDSGLLLIEVPDASRYADYAPSPFYRFDFEYINHFSIPHLRNLFGRYEFELADPKMTDNKVSEKLFLPTILSLFKKSGKLFFCPDFTLKKAVSEYICLSEKLELNEPINQLVDSQVSIYIWGLGAHTARLLKQTSLSRCNIKAFIDNDPHKAGHFLLGKPVLSSSILTGIFSDNLRCWLFVRFYMLRKWLNLPNKIMLEKYCV